LSLLGEIPLLSGTLEPGLNSFLSHLSQKREIGDTQKTVMEWLSDVNPDWTQQSIRTFAARYLFHGEDMDKSVSSLSGGEKSRLALAQLFSRAANILLLDEPTNHLDIDAREALEEALQAFRGTLLIVSHDLFFLKKTVEEFLLIKDLRLVELSNLESLPVLLAERTRIDRASSNRRGERRNQGLSKNEKMRMQQRLNELENRISAAEIRRTEVEEELQRAATDHLVLTRLSEEHEMINRELEDLYRSWEELGTILEA
jgi:ATP-binding cassette subfamily F protein 3